MRVAYTSRRSFAVGVSYYLGPISKQACYEKHCLLFEWFTLQMPSTVVVQFSDQHLCQDSDHHLNTGLLFPGTMVPGIWIVNHLNNEPVKVCYSDVSAIQKFAIQIHTIYLLVVLWLSQWFDILHKTSPFSPLLHET